jgi:hypothetical protein
VAPDGQQGDGGGWVPVDDDDDDGQEWPGSERECERPSWLKQCGARNKRSRAGSVLLLLLLPRVCPQGLQDMPL